MLKRILSLIMVVALLIGSAQAWVPTPSGTAVTVQYVIKDLYGSFGLSVPEGYTARSVTDQSGAAADADYAKYVSYAADKGWLPSSIPEFNKTATVGFTLSLAMAMLGYKNVHTAVSAELQKTRSAIIDRIVADWLAVDGITPASYTLTPATLDKVKTVIEHRYKIPQSSNAVGWDLYGKGEYENAIFAFDIQTTIIETPEVYKSYKCNAYYGLGLIYRSYNYMQYERAKEYFEKSIATDPKGASGTVGAQAKAALDSLPDVIYSPTFRPNDNANYQEFAALLHHYLSYTPQSGESLAAAAPDKLGQQPSQFASAAVRLGCARSYYDELPDSWFLPVTRSWAAVYLCRMKGDYNWDVANINPFEDTFGMSPGLRMYLSRAVELGVLIPYSSSSVNPKGNITRAEVYQIAQRMKNATDPAPVAHPSGEKPLVHTYFTSTLGTDTDLSIFDRHAGKVDMITFFTTFLEVPSPVRLELEGTKVITTNYVDDNSQTHYRVSAIQRANELGMEVYYGFSILNEEDTVDEVTAYLVSLIESDAKLKQLGDDIVHICKKYGYSGVNLGLERVDITMEQHARLASALSEALRKNGLKFIISVGAMPQDKEMYASFYDYNALAPLADYIHLLCYDSTSRYEYARTGKEGVMSSLVRIERCLKYALYAMPPEKLLLGFGSFAIDYTLGAKSAENITITEAKRRAGTQSIQYKLDTYNGDNGPYFEYTDASGRRHRVAHDTRDSFAARMQNVFNYGLGGVSYYWIGSEQPDFFTALSDVYNAPRTAPVSQASEWAHAELTAAIASGLIPEYLQNNYKNSITRAEFFDLIFSAAAVLGLDISYDAAAAFPDTAAPAVLWAAKNKVTSVTFDKPFNPFRTLSRAEAAVTMTNAARQLLGLDTAAAHVTYADSARIADWAQPSVNYMAKIGVMQGSGAVGFDPNATLPREQAMVIVYRFVRTMQG